MPGNRILMIISVAFVLFIIILFLFFYHDHNNIIIKKHTTTFNTIVTIFWPEKLIHACIQLEEFNVFGQKNIALYTKTVEGKKITLISQLPVLL